MKPPGAEPYETFPPPYPDPDRVWDGVEAARATGLPPAVLAEAARRRLVPSERYRGAWWHPFPSRRRYPASALAESLRAWEGAPSGAYPLDVPERPEPETPEKPSARGVLEASGRAPLAKLVRSLVVGAIRQGASDVHLSPLRGGGSAVRFRIDGALKEVSVVPPDSTAPLSARLKLMAGLDPLLDARPQAGVLRFTAGPDDPMNAERWVRVAVTPARHGEHVALRVAEANPRGLRDLGMAPEVQVALEDRVLAPGRVLLLASPPGEGLTTTLRALMFRLNSYETNGVLFDELIEFPHDGMDGVRLAPGGGADAPDAVRSALRQGAEFLFFGGVRDRATALAALDAAEAGATVVLCLHAGGGERHGVGAGGPALSGLLRFLALGVPRARAERLLGGMLAQRLALRADGPGRVALFETLPLTEGFWSAAPPEPLYTAPGFAEAVREAGLWPGRVTLCDSARARLASGDITEGEARRVLGASYPSGGL